ncbi:MAG: T9SS type A sorting domain-containing protein [Saprospiraceae bacterium]|nr:T9SS type A sorting domain-containing protein [Saprospiraceae bacterium]
MKQKKSIIPFLFLMFTITIINAQKEDFIWLWGDEPFDIILPDRRADTTLGASNIDFNFDPVKIYYDPNRVIDMAGANASICDQNGKLMAYSNGQVLYNGNHQAITDTINYFEVTNNSQCNEWEYNNFGDSNMSIPGGLLGHQRVVILPVGDEYYILYNNYNYCTNVVDKIAYSKFVINSENPNGKLIVKDHILIEDTLVFAIYAIRHANGKDWWVINLNKNNTKIQRFLINQYGIHYYGTIESGLDDRTGHGQICISPDGKYLAWYIFSSFTLTGGYVAFATFDRCDGTISKLTGKVFPSLALTGGVSFSADSRYLYVGNRDNIFQYEISDGEMINEQVVAVFDGFYFSIPNVSIEYSVNFCWMLLGPDGRIYVVPTSATQKYLGVIANPHEKGKACDVLQHSIVMPTRFTRTIPNLPNFRLGPLDGSPCDTLGLDNHPVAKFRYEPDTLDYLRIRFTDLSYFRPETWSWDFGDSSPKVADRYPFHRYTQNGTYNVCLTVSNENSSNTTCRTVTIGTSSSDDTPEPSAVADISLYPNPVVDFLLVTLGEYVPEYGQIFLYDMTGRQVHTQRIWYGQNNVDMSRLSEGMYVGRITDKGRLIRTVKVVKG